MCLANPFADGYTSLLVDTEGGQAKELVDEENGILISSMLRQYFMALRTVGKWKQLSEHWETVASMLKSTQTVQPSKIDTPPTRPENGLARTSSWHDFIGARLGHTKTPHDEDEDDEEDIAEPAAGDVPEDLHGSAEVGADPDHQMDVEVLLMRKFWGRWVAKAGVKSKVCDPASGACLVDWTRLIAPVLEGRIKMVGAE